MRGTIKELIAQGITINGVKVDAPTLSVLIRLGIGQVIGKAAKPTRGRTASIYEFKTGDATVRVGQ